MLKFQIPIEWHNGGSYLMNQKTFALLLTMSDAIGRPLLIASPTEGGQFLLNGSPIVIASQMPNPGATPVAFGNWRQGYMIVDRRALTMLPDPYSAGFCTLFRFETRIGGAVSCPNAIRLCGSNKCESE